MGHRGHAEDPQAAPLGVARAARAPATVASAARLQGVVGNRAMGSLVRSITDGGKSALSSAPTGMLQRVDNYTPDELEQRFGGRLSWLLPKDRVAGYLDDFKHIQAIIGNEGLMLALLEPLNAMVSRDQSGEGALTRAIRAKMRGGGFKPVRTIATGIVSTDVWLKMIQLGFVPPKDPGAGVTHGELAHQLQWCALIQSYENDPTLWRNSPLDLYKTLGHPALTVTLGDGGDPQSLFGYLMDQGGLDPSQGFRRPDYLTQTIAYGRYAKANLPALQSAVLVKYQKRKGMEAREAVTHGGDLSAWKGVYAEKKLRSGGYKVFPGENALLVRGDIPVEDLKEMEKARQYPPR